MINVTGLIKHFRVHQRPPGLLAAARSMLRRKYTTVKAVDGISFQIEPGERVGFLGPNGAGKSTTLKMLSGVLHPTAGEVRIDGHEPLRRERDFLQKITLVMGQKQQLFWDLAPAETFEANRVIYGISRAQFRSTLDELVELLHLQKLIDRPTRQLSLGERMKCELTAALIHRPKVLFLDEPSIGLDVTMQSTIRDFIRQYNQRHKATVILTSHYMEEVENLCPRVIVIDAGRLTFDGPLSTLVLQVQPLKRVVLHLKGAVAAGVLEGMGEVLSQDERSAVLLVAPEGLNRVLSSVSTLPVSDLTVENAPLEQVLSEHFARNRAPATDLPA